jgi:hypothetical protein
VAVLIVRGMGRAALAVSAALAVVVGPSVASPETAPQASASFEDVQNSKSSTRNISVRIVDGGTVFDRIVAPNSGVNAGNDRISSYYIPSGTCASINRGGVNIGVKRGPVRTNMAMAERIHAYAYPC